jgi:hypothetical protein
MREAGISPVIGIRRLGYRDPMKIWQLVLPMLILLRPDGSRVYGK